MIELKLEEGEIYDFEMINAQFNTDEHLNELLEVDRHRDYHPGGLGWMADYVGDDDGWYDDSDDENDMDEENDTDDSWETIDENGTDDDNEEK